jgi:VanZ family protein
MRNLMKKALRWLPALATMSLIFYLSTLSTKGELVESIITTRTRDDVVNSILHFCAYGFLALTIEYGFGFGKITPKERLWALLWIILYGISDEYHQSFVPGRTASLVDLTIDGLGGWRWLYGRKIFRRKKKEVVKE